MRLPWASEAMTKDSFTLEALGKVKVRELKAVLAAKLMAAQSMNINTYFEVPEEIDHIPANSFAIVRMIGIIMDNAIEALAELGSGTLMVGCFKDSAGITFIVQNNCRADIPKLHQLKEIGFSTKGSGRGLGLGILSELVASLPNATLSTCISNHNFVQKLIIIDMRKKSREAHNAVNFYLRR